MLFNFRVLEQLIGLSQEAFLHVSPALTQLIASTPAEAQHLIQAYEQKDHKAVERSLHKLRGSYGTLGALELPELSSVLELALQQHSQLPSTADFALYLDCLERTAAALDLWLGQFNYKSAASGVDVAQFIHYLDSSDMQAYSLFQQQKTGWQIYLGAEEFAVLEQRMMELNFGAAAEHLKRLMSSRHSTTENVIIESPLDSEDTE